MSSDPATIKARQKQLAELNSALEERPLQPDDKRYYRFHEAPGNPRGLDPIKTLHSAIKMADLATFGSTSCQVFSGFRGSGKSTELRRLKSELERAGTLVILVEGGSFINLYLPLETSDLLSPSPPPSPKRSAAARRRTSSNGRCWNGWAAFLGPTSRLSASTSTRGWSS